MESPQIKSSVKILAMLRTEVQNGEVIPVGLQLIDGPIDASFSKKFINWANRKAGDDFEGLLAEWGQSARVYTAWLRTTKGGKPKLFVLGSSAYEGPPQVEVEVCGRIDKIDCQKRRLTIGCRRPNVPAGTKAHNRPFQVIGSTKLLTIPTEIEVGDLVRLVAQLRNNGVIFENVTRI